MGFAETDTEALLIIRGNLLGGLNIIAKHLDAGTFKTAAKDGSAPPSQSGCLTIWLLLGVEDELESRILGFQRTIDPKLLVKTL